MSVREFALLKLFLQKRQRISPVQVRALLCVLGQKQAYLSLEEIEEKSLLSQRELEKILKGFAREQVLERQGCLYKKPEEEKIVEVIEGK
jgi:hypothetical protein